MLIYLINFAMMAVYSFFNAVLKKFFADEKAVKRVFVSAAIIQLILILALRAHTIGTDLPRYVKSFELLSGASFERYEKGYSLLYRIIALFTDNAQVMITVVAILSIVPVGIIVYKYSKMPFLSLALYIAFSYYAFTFSGLRQGIAYGLTMLSYKYIRENKFVKFIFLVIFAALFHKSAIIFAAAFFISKIKINKITIGCAAAVAAGIFVFRQQLAGFVIKYFYDAYVIEGTGAGAWMLMCTVIVVLGLAMRPAVREKAGDEADTLYMLLIAGVIMMMFASIANNAMRVANYYYMFVILFIPEVLCAVKDKKILALCAYGVVIVCMAMYIFFLGADEYSIIPYRFFWQQW